MNLQSYVKPAFTFLSLLEHPVFLCPWLRFNYHLCLGRLVTLLLNYRSLGWHWVLQLQSVTPANVHDSLWAVRNQACNFIIIQTFGKCNSTGAFYEYIYKAWLRRSWQKWIHCVIGPQNQRTLPMSLSERWLTTLQNFITIIGRTHAKRLFILNAYRRNHLFSNKVLRFVSVCLQRKVTLHLLFLFFPQNTTSRLLPNIAELQNVQLNSFIVQPFSGNSCNYDSELHKPGMLFFCLRSPETPLVYYLRKHCEVVHPLHPKHKS